MRGFAQPLLESGHRGVAWEAGGSAGGGAAEDVAAGGGAAGDGAAEGDDGVVVKNKKSGGQRKWRVTKKGRPSQDVRKGPNKSPTKAKQKGRWRRLGIFS